VPPQAAQRPRILVAGSTDAIALMTEVLRDDADVVSAGSVEEALSRFGEGLYDTIACNVRFDESRMFEFLQRLRERPEGANARVVCFRATGAELSSGMRGAIRHGLEALGVRVFVDVPQLTADFGSEAALEILRQIVVGKLR
jgi:CheY-like chemotaxis protein